MPTSEPITGRIIDSADWFDLESFEAAVAAYPLLPARPRVLSFPERLAAAQAARLCKVATKPEATKAPQTLAGKDVEADRARDCVVVRPSHLPSKLSITEGPKALRIVSTGEKPKGKLVRKSWARAKIPARDRFGYGVEVAARNGGRAFSLNLSVARERSILRSKDPTRLLSTYIIWPDHIREDAQAA
ncbi:hypothetical protein [Mesorhizobium sp. A556]